MALVRLNKLLSQTGVSSRRGADQLIEQGRVEVNGVPITELGAKADPERDDVRVDGRRLKTDTERRYLLMYKPRGVLSTRSDPHRRKTVIDLLAAAGVRGYFYPVGRLDYESEGLILLTNDGDFAERVTHPRYELERTYEALVAGVPDERDLERLRKGIMIDGQRTLPAKVRIQRVVESRGGPQAVVEVTLREGRNRQVRHMCDAIAHPVDGLRRTRIGGLTDRHLKPGQIRDLTPAEVAGLMATPASAGPPPERRPSGARSSFARPPFRKPATGRPPVGRTGPADGAVSGGRSSHKPAPGARPAAGVRPVAPSGRKSSGRPPSGYVPAGRRPRR